MYKKILLCILFIFFISCSKVKTPQDITIEANHYKTDFFKLIKKAENNINLIIYTNKSSKIIKEEINFITSPIKIKKLNTVITNVESINSLKLDITNFYLNKNKISISSNAIEKLIQNNNSNNIFNYKLTFNSAFTNIMALNNEAQSTIYVNINLKKYGFLSGCKYFILTINKIIFILLIICIVLIIILLSVIIAPIFWLLAIAYILTCGLIGHVAQETYNDMIEVFKIKLLYSISFILFILYILTKVICIFL